MNGLSVDMTPGIRLLPGVHGERGSLLRAYDKKTGADVGPVYMPAPQTGSPMTYVLNGRQFSIAAISGGSYSAELIAFALPSDE